MWDTYSTTKYAVLRFTTLINFAANLMKFSMSIYDLFVYLKFRNAIFLSHVVFWISIRYRHLRHTIAWCNIRLNCCLNVLNIHGLCPTIYQPLYHAQTLWQHSIKNSFRHIWYSKHMPRLTCVPHIGGFYRDAPNTWPYHLNKCKCSHTANESKMKIIQIKKQNTRHAYQYSRTNVS